MELLDYDSQSFWVDAMLVESDQDQKRLTTKLAIVGKLLQQ